MFSSCYGERSDLMKHKNLQILLDHGFSVPPFIVVDNNQRVDLSFSDAEYFAVRSSFESEDSDDQSFAGQFDTFLNVKRCDVFKAVENVRNSINNQNVQDYIKATENDNSGTMCVIVQEMVNSELSGVIFTANPMGILNETVITVGKGSGDKVVEDKVETTTYYYNNDDGIFIYHNQENSPLLSEALLQQIIDQSSSIKNIFGYDADIEFAVENGHIYLLQVRPITTIPSGDSIVLDNSNIVESYPGVSLPLTQDFAKMVYSGIFFSCVTHFTEDLNIVKQLEPCLGKMVDVADWRIYYRINNWYALLQLLPFSKYIIRTWQEMLGVTNTTIPEELELHIKNRTKRKILFKFIKYIFYTPKYMKKLNMSFAERYEEYKRKTDACQTIEECIDLFYYLHDNVLAEWDITLINDIYTFIFTALSGKRNKEQIADVRNLESMKPLLAINELMKICQNDGIDSRRYLEAEKEYINLYGDRCLGELKMETKTYRVDPMLLRRQVISNNSSELPVGTVKKNKNPFVKRAKIGIKNREISRMNRSRLFGLSRQLFLKIGTLLSQQGRLDCSEDVFYLHFNELLLPDNFKDRVAFRKEKENFFREIPSFGRLVYANEIINHNIGGQGCTLYHEHELRGIATSTGVAEAEVIVVEQPDCTLDTTGKILVTRSTDPGWVFLIQNACGIIAEKGSLLSHTAIISRELHKPAVVNVKDCTKILKNGDKVRLNAYDGTVTIL